jgi:hypothetical protein
MGEGRRGQVEPEELARLLDLSERSRQGDWSLRSALTRYAQPEPRRVAELLDLVRRIDAAVSAELRTLAADGPRLWSELQDAAAAPDRTVPAEGLVGLLATMTEVDRLGDVLATWATDLSAGRPNELVDEVVTDVRSRLATLGVPEQGPPPPGVRRRG